MVLGMKVNGLEFIKIAKLTKRYDKYHRRPSMIQSVIIIHPFQLLAGGISPGHTSHALHGNNI
jgi:hypothetical protein